MSNLIFSVTDQPSYTVDGNLIDPFGEINFNGTSKALWTPYPDYNGFITFSYKVNDTENDSVKTYRYCHSLSNDLTRVRLVGQRSLTSKNGS